jgi:hypothetical protein
MLFLCSLYGVLLKEYHPLAAAHKIAVAAVQHHNTIAA